MSWRDGEKETPRVREGDEKNTNEELRRLTI